MVHSKNIHHEKKKIDKLAEFSEKVNRFINTKLVKKENAELLDVVDKINDRLMHDKKYLKNLQYDGPMTTQNSVLYNSPFMPGHTMAFDGKKSVPVANPLGTAALGMTANSMSELSLALSSEDALTRRVRNDLNNEPHPDDMNFYGLMPMAIDNRKRSEPYLKTPQPNFQFNKSGLEPPTHLTSIEPARIGPKMFPGPNNNKFNRLGMSLGGLGAIPTADLPVVTGLAPGMPVMAPGMPVMAPAMPALTASVGTIGVPSGVPASAMPGVMTPSGQFGIGPSQMLGLTSPFAVPVNSLGNLMNTQPSATTAPRTMKLRD